MISTYKTVIPEIEIVKLGSPISAQIELTGMCQYRCSFCYNIWKASETSTPHSHMSEEQAFYVANELIKARVFSVILSGGEPTLVGYLPQLIQKFADASIDVSMISNGALLTSELLTKMMHAGLSDIQISMHHYEPATFERIVNHFGAYKATLTGIENAIRILGPDNVNVNTVVTKANAQHIAAMLAFLVANGVENYSVSMVSSSGVASLNNLRCDYTDVSSVYHQLAEYSDQVGVAFVGGMPFCALPDDYDAGKVRMANICDAAIGQIAIGPDGGIRPCVEWPKSGGNIFEDSLVEIWQDSPVFTDIREYRNTPPTCHTCNYVAFCHGGCRASALSATRDPLGYDPLMPDMKAVREVLGKFALPPHESQKQHDSPDHDASISDRYQMAHGVKHRAERFGGVVQLYGSNMQILDRREYDLFLLFVEPRSIENLADEDEALIGQFVSERLLVPIR